MYRLTLGIFEVCKKDLLNASSQLEINVSMNHCYAFSGVNFSHTSLQFELELAKCMQFWEPLLSMLEKGTLFSQIDEVKVREVQ